MLFNKNTVKREILYDEYVTSFKFRKTRNFPKMEKLEFLIIIFTVAIAKLILCVKLHTFNSRYKQFM
jgi:hypothetical protein